MLLEFTHTTELTYTDFISESVMELRVCPAQVGDQHRLSFDLAIGPAAQVHSYFDWLDNHVHAFTVNGYHDRIRIVATSVVETDRPEPPLEAMADLPDRWPLENVDADYALYDFLQFDGPVTDSVELRELAGEIKPVRGEPVGEILIRTLDLVRDRFEYVKGVTTSASSVDEVLRHGKGVCQDYTHVMIGLLRALGIPTRYVSGIVHSDQRADQPHYLGATQTHAWVEAYLPSQINEETGGWTGLDPTNHCPVGSRFLKVAVGRHFADVPPNKGVYRGKADEKIDVSVSTRWLATVPPELMPERVRRLPVASSPVPPRPISPVAGPLQQQQQQQQQ